ncbi:ABC transporter permease [Gracilimonas tropica]|uniref:ABC transporter permease n=1 Tax=Gracilimonas tropica TaxID=454600 RepID=UPI000368D2A9|nr:FtsX-like permease family protein [Gracilimonas tropica]
MQQIFKSISIALQNIKTNPLYTFLSTLGIIIGVASLVAILALGDGLEQTGRQQIETTTSVQMLSISPKKFDVVNDVRVPRENTYEFDVEHAREIEGRISDLGLTELIARSSRKASFKDSTLGIYIEATLDDLPSFNEMAVSGAYFGEEEISGNALTAVLSTALARQWDTVPEAIIGESIQIENRWYEVMGIIETGSEGLQAFIPISTYLNYFENPNEPNLVLKSFQVEDVPVIRERAETWLDERFGEGRGAFTISSYEGRVKQLSQGILVFKLVMGAITGISVLVGGIGIMNVLLISVTERTREIGIRKATGARKKDIVMQFLSESVTISVVGSILGWIVGIVGVFGLVELINYMTDLNFNAALQPGTILIVLLIAICVGMIFGTYPAWKAANLTPVDAIRHE